jgi:hypothetical protein
MLLRTRRGKSGFLHVCIVVGHKCATNPCLLSFLFEEMLNGRANRFASARFQSRPREHSVETEEQYQARIKRQREEQAAAAQRRKVQEEAWKVRRQMERESGQIFSLLHLP